ncbi:hypothetical protein CCH79_00002850 [Gambusia affinis]|uniref:Uncharacterized protein n=1 Tax=Gambusia affinis TaxID=33528 RepID=A0A315W683_GAMAF|nr:hypothetical protein CCH79_00002850 [Gambusia affinis]
MGNAGSIDQHTDHRHNMPLKLPMPESGELEERFAHVLLQGKLVALVRYTFKIPPNEKLPLNPVPRIPEGEPWLKSRASAPQNRGALYSLGYPRRSLALDPDPAAYERPPLAPLCACAHCYPTGLVQVDTKEQQRPNSEEKCIMFMPESSHYDYDRPLLVFRMARLYFSYVCELHGYNSMNLPPDKARLLRQYDNEKKWELICDQISLLIQATRNHERFQVKNPPHTYLQKLRSYLDPAVTRKDIPTAEERLHRRVPWETAWELIPRLDVLLGCMRRRKLEAREEPHVDKY